MSYAHFQVGEKFPLPIKEQGEGGIFQYDKNGVMFILKLNRLDLIAIEAFRTGKLEIGLFIQNDIIFFLYKIDGIFGVWSDAPYHVQFHPQELRPDFSQPQEKQLNLYLVDGRLDMLMAMRNVDMSEHFQKTLIWHTQQQLNHSFDESSYRQRIQQIWQEKSSSIMADTAAAHQLINMSIPPKQPLQN